MFILVSRMYKYSKLFMFFLCLCVLIPELYTLGRTDSLAGETVLRIGIMPDVNCLPLMVARDEGFFIDEKINVELINFTNAQERDAAIQAGRIDGASSDLLAAALFAAGGFPVKVTSLTNGRYGIVLSPSSSIKTLADLAGKRVGISANTVIQYTVEALFDAFDIPANAYEPVAVPRMPIRLEMVLLGQLDAACLPEPMLTAAIEQGGTLLSTTDEISLVIGILLFSKEALDNRLDDIKRFYKAYDRAAQKINAAPDAYREYLVEKAAFPEQVKNAYNFVHYEKPALPEISQIEKVLSWLGSRGLLTKSLNAGDLLDIRAITE